MLRDTVSSEGHKMQNKLNMKVRSAARRNCRLFGDVRYLGKNTNGRIVDLSATGVSLDLGGPFYGATGSKVHVECDDLGSLEGIVRWFRNGRIGVEFSRTSNASAQIASYFRFFHKETQPVLKR
jgi:hypothetical protein